MTAVAGLDGLIVFTVDGDHHRTDTLVLHIEVEILSVGLAQIIGCGESAAGVGAAFLDAVGGQVLACVEDGLFPLQQGEDAAVSVGVDRDLQVGAGQEGGAAGLI